MYGRRPTATSTTSRVDARRLALAEASVTRDAVGRALAPTRPLVESGTQALLLERALEQLAPSSRPCPGTMRSRNSTTSTSAPSRRHTEPSSSPIAPAPTTSRRFGTARQRQRLGRADDALAVERQRRAARSARCRSRSGSRVVDDASRRRRRRPRRDPARDDAARAARAASILFFLNSPATPLREAVHDLVLARHHRRQVERDVADADAVRGEAVARLRG